MLRRLAQGVTKHRAATGAALLVAVVLAILGAVRISVDFSSASFYGDDTEARRDLEAFVQRWGSDDRTLFVVAHVPDGDEGSLLDPIRVQAIADLSRALERLAEVESTTSLATMKPVEGVELATLTRLSNIPIVHPLLVSSDLRTAAIVVSLRESTDDLGTAIDVVSSIEAVLDQPASDDDASRALRFDLGGLPAVRAAFFELVLRDQLRLVPLTLAAIGLGLWVVYRRLHGIVVPAFAAGLPVLFLVGTMGWLGEPIGLLNQAYFTLLPVIAIADAIHLLSRFHEERRGRDPHDPAIRSAAIETATARVGWACALASMTTALGFASLLIADMPILRSFGAFAAVGVAYAWLVVVVGVPWLLAVLPPRWTMPSKNPRFDVQTSTATAVANIARIATRRPWVVSGLAITLCAIALAGFPKVRVDNKLTGLLDPDHPVARASHRIDRDLGGVLSLELELHRSGGWESPAAREALREVEAAVANTSSPRVILGPTTLATLATLGAEGTPTFLAGDHARVSIRVADVGGRAFARFRADVETLLEPLASAHDFTFTATGTTAVAYAGVNRITDDLRTSLIGVFLVVTVTIAVLFASIGVALRSIPPNLAPLILGYGAVGWIGLELDPLATVVLVIALGIAIDDTIHLLARHAEERAPDPGTRIIQAARHSGTAMTLTSVILAVGLSINLASSFPPLRVLGGLGSVVILLALAADLLLLPALMRLPRKGSRR